MKDKCLNPSCQRSPAHRGLCLACYVTAGNFVRKGKTTWEKLVAEGKALEARQRNGRGATANWLLS